MHGADFALPVSGRRGAGLTGPKKFAMRGKTRGFRRHQARMTTDTRLHGLTIGPAGPAAAAVVAWRRRQLVDAGFEPEYAGRLAAVGDLDLHVVLSLVDRGCPPSLAARIVSGPDPAGE